MTSLNRHIAISASTLALLCSAQSARAGTPPPSGITLAPPIDVAPTVATTQGMNANGPSFATNGTDALVCWTESVYHTRVSCARYAATGTVVDAGAIVLDASLGAAHRPLVSWDGTRYAILVGNVGQHLEPATGALDAPFTIPAASGAPIAAGGGFTLMLNGTAGTIYDASFAAVGQLTIPTQLAQGTSFTPLAAFSAGTFLVAWPTPAPAWQIFGVRISTSAALLDAAPIMLRPSIPYPGVAGANWFFTSLALGGGSSGFFLAWGDPRGSASYDTYGTPVGLDGSVATPGGALVAPSTSPSTIAGAGGSFVIASGASLGSNAAVTMVSALGVAGTTVTVATGSSAQARPAVVATGATTFFAWPKKTGTWGGSDVSAIAGERLAPSGAVLDAQPAWLSTLLVGASAIQIAATPSGYLVAWEEGFTWYGARLARDGTPLDSPPLVLSTTASTIGISAAGDTYFIVGGNYVTELPTVGPPAIYFAGQNKGLSSVLCAKTRCVAVSQGGTEEMLGAGGLVVVQSLVTPGDVVATDGTSFLVLGSEANDGGASSLIASIMSPSAVLGPPAMLPQDYASAGPVAWGNDRYMALRNWADPGILRLGADGSMLEPETTLAMGRVDSWGVIWDGRAFLVTGAPIADQTNPSPLPFGVEVAASGPAPVADAFSLFDAPVWSVVSASSASGDVLIATLQQRGGSAGALRPVTRRITVSLVAPPSDAGAHDAASDADASDADARDPDASDGAVVDAEAPPSSGDASANDAGHLDDAGAIDGGHLMDASDGGAREASGEGGGGCGCSNAGADAPAGFATALACLAALALAASRRRANARRD